MEVRGAAGAAGSGPGPAGGESGEGREQVPMRASQVAAAAGATYLASGRYPVSQSAMLLARRRDGAPVLQCSAAASSGRQRRHRCMRSNGLWDQARAALHSRLGVPCHTRAIVCPGRARRHKPAGPPSRAKSSPQQHVAGRGGQKWRMRMCNVHTEYSVCPTGVLSTYTCTHTQIDLMWRASGSCGGRAAAP